MDRDLGAAVAALWQTDAIKKAFARRSEFWNLDAAP